MTTHPSKTDNTAVVKRPFLAVLFVSPDERRLRAGWRLGFHTLLVGLFTLTLQLGSYLILPWFPFLPADLLQPLLPTAAITLATLLARRWLDHRSFASLGLLWSARALKDLFFGLALSAGLMTLIFGIEWSLGWIAITGTSFQQLPTAAVLGNLAQAGLLYACVGYYEELYSRGYQLQTLADGTTILLGIVLSSSFFGFLHIANPNASLLSTAGIVLAGLFLAYGWLRTRQLWLSIGFHFGWNFFQGTVFGFPVSGIGGFSLLILEDTSSTALSGGAFGPEASILILPVLLLGMAVITIATRGRVETT